MNLADAAHRAASEAGIHLPRPTSHEHGRSMVLEQLVQEVASPRTHNLLKEYYKQSKVEYSLRTFLDMNPGLYTWGYRDMLNNC